MFIFPRPNIKFSQLRNDRTSTKRCNEKSYKKHISTRPEIERNDNDNVKNPKIYEGLIILK